MARLIEDAAHRLTEWLDQSMDRAEGDRQLFIRLVESIGSGTWLNRDWFVEYDPAQDLYDLQPREGLHILLYIEPGETGEECVGVAGIDYEPAGDGEYPDGMPY